MSLINDALRKSTRQPPSPSIVPHEPRPGDPYPRPPRKNPVWLPLSLAAVLLLLLGIRSVTQEFSRNKIISQTQIDQPALPADPTKEETPAQLSLPVETVSFPQRPEGPAASSGQPFTLNGVVTGNPPLALINNRVVQKGEEIDGYVLKEVFPKKVILEKEGKTVEARLP